MSPAKVTTLGASKSPFADPGLAAQPPARRGQAAAAAAAVASGGAPTVLLVLADIGAGARGWGWSRIVLGSLLLRRVPGLRFAKVLGSGHEGGFGLRPSASRQGMFLVFDTPGLAQAFAESSAVMGAYRARADELCTLTLRPLSSRGSWDGYSIAVPPAADPLPEGRPVAALTRASIRPLKAAAFWRHSPPSERSLAAAAGCRLAVGLGEAPLLRQATFSVWDSVEAMQAYARTAAHGEAARAAWREGYFSESMFVRFEPLGIRGRWQGREHG